MATLLHTAPLVGTRPHVRVPRLEVVIPTVIMLACAVFGGRLIGAVTSAPPAPVAASAVSIDTSGSLSVAGLGSGGTTVSTLSVTNAGDSPLRWAVYPTTTGTAGVADQLDMQVYLPATSGTCSASALGSAVSLRTPSAAPLAPGETTSVCVVLTMPAAAASTAGTVTPGISFTGTPA